MKRVRWTALSVGVAMLGVGSALLTPSGYAATEGRALRVADAGGSSASPMQYSSVPAPESAGATFSYLAARASGLPVAQVAPTPGPDTGVRVILAPDARGPLPPAVTVPAAQLPPSVAAAMASSAPSGAMGASAAAGGATGQAGAAPAGSVAASVGTGAVGSASGPMPLLSTSGGTTASSSGSGSTTGRIIPNLPATPGGARIVNIAQAQIGARYTWAGVSPSTGFDCSGFVYYVFSTIGRPIPRTLDEQMASGRRVRLEELRPGDVLFYADTYTTGLSHNGIYIGDGKFVHAVDESTGVAVTPVNAAYWDSRFVTAVRIVD